MDGATRGPDPLTRVGESGPVLPVPQHIRPRVVLTSEQRFLVTYLLPHLHAVSILTVGPQWVHHYFPNLTQGLAYSRYLIHIFRMLEYLNK